MLPFHLGAGDARRALRQLRQVELDDRQRFGIAIADHRDVDLTALDVLLDQDRGVELGVHAVDALHQLLQAADDGAEADADGAVLERRLDDAGEVDVVRPVETAAVAGHKIRRADAVEGEDLLREGLVLREVEAV